MQRQPGHEPGDRRVIVVPQSQSLRASEVVHLIAKDAVSSGAGQMPQQLAGSDVKDDRGTGGETRRSSFSWSRYRSGCVHLQFLVILLTLSSKCDPAKRFLWEVDDHDGHIILLWARVPTPLRCLVRKSFAKGLLRQPPLLCQEILQALKTKLLARGTCSF